jgi:ribonucleoside-diphosphate reductase beta chain
MDRWLRNDSVDVLPQETEITSYLVGSIDRSVKDNDFTL